MSRFLQNGLRLIDDILAMVFQADCAACGRGHLPLESGLCRYCRVWFPLRGPLCERCGTPLPEALAPCGECARFRRPALEAARSLLWLDDSTKNILHRIKYGGRFEYLSLFRPSIESGFTSFFEGRPAVVPVPLHPSRLAARGFNQAELLARVVARVAALHLEVDAFRKVRVTATQAGLSSTKRRHNLRGSFRWRGRRIPESVLLIDDVYTTGATLQACARTLRRAGIERVYAWTLLRTPKPQ